MTATVPLIISEEPVSRGLLARTKLSKPNIAVVYSDAFGRIADLGGRPLSWSEQVASRYRTRYEVDLSDHRRQASLESSPLPARGDMYFFRSIVDVGFRVTDPVAVVSRHVTDGLVVVYNFLIDAFRPIARRYDITDAEGAEEELNQRFLNPVQLPEGITIYRCATRLEPDSTAQQYLRGLETAQRSITLGSARHGAEMAATRNAQELGGLQQEGRFAGEDRELEVQHRRAMQAAARGGELGFVQHDVDVATARRAQVIEGINQQGRLGREQLELEAMAGLPVDIGGIIRTHLARHPDETPYAMELLIRYEQAKSDRDELKDTKMLDLVRYMTDRGLIQSVDVEKLRTRALDRVTDFADADPSAAQAAGSWNEPLGVAAPATVTRAVPVYVIVDESVVDPGYFEVLNRSIQALPTELAANQEIASSVRLAVIGYSAGVDVRMPLNSIGPGGHVPEFSHHQGSDLSAVFDDLYERIPSDAVRLKEQGITLGRPIVHLLSATLTDEGQALSPAYRRLTDQATFPYAPTIIPCGIGQSSPGPIGQIATHAEAAWIAAPETPVGDATTYYLAFVRTSIVGLSLAHQRGDFFGITGPHGFRLAAESP